ncbi:MAG: hypothetical protein ACYDCL_16730 [Myxococcales bacterium]
MKDRTALWVALAALLLPALALAQHAVRPKDAEAPVAVPQQPVQPQIEPLVDVPGARKQAAPIEEGERRPDAGPPPKFKDDLGPDDAQVAAPARRADCTAGCELLLTKRFESYAFTLHVRPAQPKPGKLLEIVVDVSEVLDPPDPEYGDHKPLTGETLVAHVEGVGRFLLHPLERDDGAYGFHFTPTGAGNRSVEIARKDGRPGLEVTFNVPVGQAPAKGAEVRDWSAPGPEAFEAVAVQGPSSASPSEDE